MTDGVSLRRAARRRRLLGLIVVVVSVVTVLSTASAVAAEGDDDADTAAGAERAETGPWLFGSFEAGFEELRSDGYLRLDVRLGFETDLPAFGCDDSGADAPCRSPFRAALQAPLRLRMIDGEPQDDGVIRREDWDEISDVGRVIRRVEYGSADDAIHAKIGELGPATLGHGTLMNAYYNVITPGGYQLGVTGDADFETGGGELVVDNAFGPEVVGARVFARPLVIAEEAGSDNIDGADRWEAGVSVVGDLSAPYSLRDPSQTAVVGPERRPRTVESRGTALLGLDMSYRLVDEESWSLTPYADANHHVQLGSGLHAGSRGEWALTSDISVQARAEFRWMGPSYLPGYVDPLYEVDRYQMTGWGTSLPAPRLRVAADDSRGSTLGAYGEWTLAAGDHSQATLAFEEYTGPENGALRFHVQAAPNERFQIGGFFYNQGLGKDAGLFELESSLIAVESRVQIVGPMYATGGYGHLWELRGDGRYEPIDRWTLGVGVSGALAGQ